MTDSKIEWTDRSDWNPVRGCSRVTEACTNCYAEAIAARFCNPGLPFEGFAHKLGGEARWTGKVELIEDRLLLPLSWRKPARCFANSTSDFFHEKLPDEAIDRLFAVMALAPHITFQVLTKRPERMRDYLSRSGVQFRVGLEALGIVMEAKAKNAKSQIGAGIIIKGSDINPGALVNWLLPNVWLGTSIHDQASADEFLPLLSDTPAAMRFASYEPALGPIKWAGFEFLDWLIAGGESGPKARPAYPDWFRAARDWCVNSGTAFFFK